MHIQVEIILRTIYQKVGYVEYVREAEVRAAVGTVYRVTVMGRAVHLESEEDEDDDLVR